MAPRRVERRPDPSVVTVSVEGKTGDTESGTHQTTVRVVRESLPFSLCPSVYSPTKRVLVLRPFPRRDTPDSEIPVLRQGTYETGVGKRYQVDV